jgi:hypothetical protein
MLGIADQTSRYSLLKGLQDKSDTTISTFEIIRSLWRSCAIFTAIRGPQRARFWLAGVEAGVPSEPAFGLLGWKPVKRGLCERPEDWQWSSFRHYATGAEARVEIESEWTARKRERAAGTLCPAVELPHSSQNRA